MKKTKKKVLSNIDKLKEKILGLEKELKLAKEETLEQVEYWHGKYDSLNEKFTDFESKYNLFFNRIESTTLPVFKENQWLKETIELLTIPADKLGKLEEIRRERIQREDPLSNYNKYR